MNDTRWKTHWDTYPNFFSEQDFLKQVGKTVNQQPVPLAHIAYIVRTIASALDLRSDDHAIDLCCGNGLITSQLADNCSGILGIDFSAPLISIANTYHRPPNVQYVCRPVQDLPDILTGHDQVFRKAYLYEAVQHFDHAQVRSVLNDIARTAAYGVRLFLGSIPDWDRIFQFYDTPLRRNEYERRVREGTELIGTWWRGGEIAEIAAEAGFSCEIRQQNPLLYTAHYRFDALLELSP